MSKTLLPAMLCAIVGLAPISHAQDVDSKKVPARAVQTEKKVPKVFQVDKPVDLSLALTDLEGKKHTFEQYLGKTVVVDFWSIKCPVSVRYEPRLKALLKKYAGNENVVFLAINSNYTELDEGDDPYERIRKYVKDAKIPYPVLIDKENVVADRFGAKTTPHVFVIDGKGILRYAGGLDNDASVKKTKGVETWAANAIAEVAAGKPVTLKNTKPLGCGIKRLAKKVKPGTVEKQKKVDG